MAPRKPAAPATKVVKMIRGITGYRNEQPWPPAGGTIELPAAEADDLIAAGHAEEAPSDAATVTAAEAPEPSAVVVDEEGGSVSVVDPHDEAKPEGDSGAEPDGEPVVG